jgi:uncharacterized membrane protein
MPFCTQCGTEVSASAAFCQGCGASQGKPAAPAAASGQGVLETMSPRTASMLCYVPWLGWIACVVVLAAERFRRDNEVRFHAFQGLYLFVAWLIVDSSWGIGRMIHFPIGSFRYHLDGLFQLALLGVWIYMLVQTRQNVKIRLPLLGEWAERSLTRNA